MNQGLPHLVKTGLLKFSLGWLEDEVRENLWDFRKASKILSFFPLKLHVLLPFTKQICCTTINKFGIKYWISNPVWVKFQEHGSSFYVNIEKKSMIIGEKILTYKDWQTGRLKLRFLAGIGQFQWNRGEKSPTSPVLVSPD